MRNDEASLPAWLRWARCFLAGASLGLAAGLGIAVWLGPALANRPLQMLLAAAVVFVGFLPAAVLEVGVRLHRLMRHEAVPVHPEP
ncbi:hypothetical protein [Phycisphaera mikurensis]|uniref:Uncharacterized protein n=1 Tax=Phycisphaera mikurensis (strain NBRC 102666 / KCTC 22515 / FYK2301M01) TaxID=1142394 RepID=I0IEI6_PHYMF|nr:hypothetical protein [Phycisphaera mikurensis]MBB6441473.1 hypothetical protein [Phycisphaera mikurensis]BAM03674.1 hypothetical protein PSMK_15150 [Phycisphaera mikurensis NBRC 102666]